ncbi:MAG: STY4526/YPO1902 family pathogenicity island replication protein [Pseudomonadota bacterium]
MKLAMFPVNDVSARSVLLQEISRRIEKTQINELQTSGLDVPTIDRLRALPYGTAICLADLAADLFFVGIDTGRLHLLLDAMEERNRAAALLEYYVEHGATLTMIRALLRPRKDVLAAYIEKLCGALPRGRPSLPEVTIRDRIHAVWAEIQKSKFDLPERERLVELHRAFSVYSMATLYSVLNEFKR